MAKSASSMLWFLAALSTTVIYGSVTSSSSSIILVPGDGGSALEMRINGTKPVVPHFFCEKTTRGKWKRLWFATGVLVPGYVDCWADNMMLRYERSEEGVTFDEPTFRVRGSSTTWHRVTKTIATSKVSNAPGVDIRPVAGKQGLEVLKGRESSNVYRSLIDLFGDGIDAKPYDFRLSPAGNTAFVIELQDKVEETFRRTQEKVTLLSHSLGCAMVHHFLTMVVTQDWKDRYIHAWIPISPALGGVPLDLLQVVTGVSPVKWLEPQVFVNQQRSYESSVWLMPDPHLYKKEDILVQTSTANYSAHDYLELFAAIGFDTGPLILNRVQGLTPWVNTYRSDDGVYALEDPNVSVFPVYGSNLDTPMQYVYDDIKSIPTRVVTSIDGDNTVPKRNLALCNTFLQSHAPLVLDGQGHNDVLSHPETLLYVQSIVNGSIVATKSPM